MEVLGRMRPTRMYRLALLLLKTGSVHVPDDQRGQLMNRVRNCSSPDRRDLDFFSALFAKVF